MTVREALRALERLYRVDDRPCLKTMGYQTKPLLEELGDRALESIKAEEVVSYIEARLEAGAARATVNHETGYLRRAFKLARERGDVERVPPIRQLRVHNARSGYLLPDEFRRLVRTLEVLDDVVADIVRFLYLLGWRKGEVLGLRWEEIQDGLVTLPSRRSKNGAARVVRLAPELLDVVRRRRAAQNGPHVFHRGGRPVKSFRKTWKRAVKALGRPEIIPHDLRRSFARNAIQAGVPQALVMAIGGWKTTAMFHRYAIVDEDELGQAVERVEGFCCEAERHIWAPSARATRARRKAEG